MAIKVRCGNCEAGFQAKDELAGRRVKCPKCKQPLTIPAAKATSGKATSGKVPAGKTAASKTPASKKPRPAPVAAAQNPLLDLLDEHQIKSVAQGPICDNCAAELFPGAIVCIECGYNTETGAQLQTEVYVDDDDGVRDVGVTDADRIMAKAEKDIDDTPVTSDGQDFGDGADSFLIAIVMGVIGLLLIGIGLAVIFTMDTINQYVTSSAISFVASIGLYVMMGIWLTWVAFKSKANQGIACVCTGLLWCIVFGFMQGKQLLLPTIIMIAALVVGAASGTYTSYNGWTPSLD